MLPWKVHSNFVKYSDVKCSPRSSSGVIPSASNIAEALPLRESGKLFISLPLERVNKLKPHA